MSVTRRHKVDNSYDSFTKRFKILNPKQRLLNMVCANLIKEPNFSEIMLKMPSRNTPYMTNQIYMAVVELVVVLYDRCKDELLDLVFTVSRRDPEFVLKLAVYVRNDLGIRSTANFLLAAAAICQESREHYLKYYHRAIKLPSDWLEVCSYYVVIRRHVTGNWISYHHNPTKIIRTLFTVKDQKLIDQYLVDFKHEIVPGRDLPAVLQQAMREKFLDFDVYQLAKYNKDNSIRRKFLKKTFRERKMKERRDPQEVSIRGRGGRGRGRVSRMRVGGRVTRKELSAEEELPTDAPAETEYNSEDSDEVYDSDEEAKEEKKIKKAEVNKKLDTVNVRNPKPQFTMKKLVRVLHMTEPKEYVLSILGKKYPETEEEFKNMGLDMAPLSRKHSKSSATQASVQEFDINKAGTRMRLPIPQTWETELSAKGNVASTWEGLIDAGKLPFMAMLRNLRNLLITGVAPKYHDIVISKLIDAEVIKHSQQFPFRFFSAYQSINVDLKKLKELTKMSEATLARKDAGGGKKVIVPVHLPDAELIEKYRSALDQSVQHAVSNNIKQIKGVTGIFVDTSDSMKTNVCTSAKAGNFTESLEIGILLGLMCNFVCEKSDFHIYSSASLVYPEDNYQNMTSEIKEGLILANMHKVIQRANSMGGVREFPVNYFKRITNERIFVDQAIFISDMKFEGKADEFNATAVTVQQLIQEYRRKVNPNFLFYCIDLFGSGQSIVNMNQGEKDPLDITITGFSDQILRFIAEKSDEAQLRYVQNIDVIKRIDTPQLLVSANKPHKKMNKKKAKKQKKLKTYDTSAHQNNVYLLDEHHTSAIPSLQNKTIIQIISKGQHCLFLTDNGSIYAIGKAGGLLTSNCSEPKLLLDSQMLKQLRKSKQMENEYIVQISSGVEHLVAVSDKGYVYVTGGNTHNQLGTVTDTSYSKDFIHLDRFAHSLTPKIVQVACGSYHTLFLSEAGLLFGAGKNDMHQLGVLDHGGLWETRYNTPQKVALPENMAKLKSISCGGSHSALLDKNGNLWTIGNNSHGQCGFNGSMTATPVRVTEFDAAKRQDKEKVVVASVSCGEYHTAVLTNEGIVYTFGNGRNGALGISTAADHEFSPQVVNSYPCNYITSIECSNNHTIAISKTGRLYSSGFTNRDENSDLLKEYLPSLVTTIGERKVLLASFSNDHKVVVTESKPYLNVQLMGLVNDDTWSNLVLCADGLKLNAHKYIIDARCPRLLTHYFQISSSSLPTMFTYTTSELSGKIVAALVEYLYSDYTGSMHQVLGEPQYELNSKSDWVELQEVATKLELSRLTTICQNQLKNQVEFAEETLSRDMLKLLSAVSTKPSQSVDYDCELVVQSNSKKQIPCHSAIVAARCEYLNSSLLFENLKLGTIGQTGLTTLTLEEVDNEETVTAILHYLYTGAIPDELINSENALDILRVAHKFCLKPLQETLENKITQFISVDNVAVVLECADFFQWEILKAYCMHFTVTEEHMSTVFSKSSYKELQRNNILLADEIKQLQKKETKRKQQNFARKQ